MKALVAAALSLGLFNPAPRVYRVEVHYRLPLAHMPVYLMRQRSKAVGYSFVPGKNWISLYYATPSGARTAEKRLRRERDVLWAQRATD